MNHRILLIKCRTISDSLPPYETVAPPFPLIQIGCKTRSSHKMTLVLDLDETLLTSRYSDSQAYDYSFKYNEEHNVFYLYMLDLCQPKTIRKRIS